MSKPPLNLRKIRALAGEVWFARGEAYYQQGRVAELSEHQGKLSAIVTGTEDYRVRLWTEDNDLSYSCTCPLGTDDQFCKHCVAAALAWLAPAKNESDAPSVPPALAGGSDTRPSDLRAFLEQQEKESLIAMLLREAANNRGAHERLLLDAARQKASGVDLGAFRRSIANATRTGGFVDYNAAPDYARRVHQVIDSISLLLDDGHAKAVVALTEYTLTKLEKAIGEMDDSDGHMGEILPDLQELHHRACEQAGEDPNTLARRLFDWELKSDWGVFSGAAEMYADVFGPQGLAEYRRLAEAEWKKLPALGPGDDPHERFISRFRITSMMESLARQSGVHEALVAVKRHDLSHPYSFLQIAEIYRQAGKDDQALEWAEEGMRAFPRVDSRLSDFVAGEYHRRGRHAEAMDLIWAQFIETPRLDTYQKLQAHALMYDKLQFVADGVQLSDTMSDKLPMSDKLQFVADSLQLPGAMSDKLPMSDKLQFVADFKKVTGGEQLTRPAKKSTRSRTQLKTRNSKLPSGWSSWREKALAHLRAITKTESEQRAQPAYSSQHAPDHSRLVEIFLWEKNYEEAWQEATAGGCTGYLWLQLADAIAKDHPDRALPIYQELIAPTLAETNNAAYDEAIKLLGKMRRAMVCMDRAAEFDDYLAALRVEYKRKRNFIKLLDGLRK